MTTIQTEHLKRVMGGVAPATDPEHTRSRTVDDGYAEGVRQKLRDGLGYPGSNAGPYLEHKGDPTPNPGNPHYGSPGGTDV